MKTLGVLLTAIGLLFTVTGNAFAQEKEKIVHIKIIKDGDTSLDTTFAAGDIEDDEINEMIFELAGMDMDVDIYVDEEMDIDMEGGEKKKTIIKKKISIKKEAGEEGDDEFIIIKKSNEEEIEINEESGEKKVIKITEGGNGSEEKMIWITTDSEGDKSEKTKKIVKIYSGDEKSGTEFANSDVKVVKTESGEEITIKVMVEEEKETTGKTQQKTKKSRK